MELCFTQNKLVTIHQSLISMEQDVNLINTLGFLYFIRRYFSYYVYEAKAGLNSITLKNNGRRIIEFADDKQRVEYNFAYEQYSGTFMGVVKVEVFPDN